MYEDEDRESYSSSRNKITYLTHGNYSIWLYYTTNRIKGLKSQELEIMLVTGDLPDWRMPLHDDEHEENGIMVRMYTDDNAGIEDCNYDRAQVRERKKFTTAFFRKQYQLYTAASAIISWIR